MTALSPGEPFHAAGGRAGVLLCHGFTGSPKALRPWAEHLAAHGLSVGVPRLPGHGTTWRELNRTRWEDWYDEVDRALHRLSERCQSVVAGCPWAAAWRCGSPSSTAPGWPRSRW